MPKLSFEEKQIRKFEKQIRSFRRDAAIVEIIRLNRSGQKLSTAEKKKMIRRAEMGLQI